MSRTLNSPISDQRAEFVYLYDIEHSGGTLRLTNASHDITALSQAWTAVGPVIIHSAAPDTPDRRGQGLDLELYGVDQTIIQQVQNNQFRGRLIKIYLLHLPVDDGDPTYTADLVFQGRQNGDYRISEARDFDAQSADVELVKVTTRISADLAAINQKVSTRCNVLSHEEMLRRSGVVAPDDKFFERLPALMNKDIFWGTDNPEKSGWHGLGAGGADRHRDNTDVWI